MSENDDLRERVYLRALNKCLHFNGVQHGTCKAGVAYKDIWHDPNGGSSTPCHDKACTRCPKQQFPTPEQAREEADKWEKLVEEATRRIKEGLCHECGAKVEKKVQVGRCVYAEPCGHRLYQGRA